MVRFLHTADWQIGMTRHFLEGEAQARFSEARLDAIRRCGDIAREQDCAFMVVGGDVFETNRLGRQVVARALEAMGRTGVPVYLLPGNHDPLNAGSVWTTTAFADRPANVHLLDAAVTLEVNGETVELLPAPWRTKEPLTDLVEQALEAAGPPTGTRVVVGHGAVDALNPDDGNPALIRLESLERRVRAGEVHYIALGDRHSVTEVGSTGRIRYSGSPLVTAYVEDAPNHALVVDAGPGRVEVATWRTGDWRFLVRRFELSGAADVERMEEELLAIPDKTRTSLKIGYRAALNLATNDRLEQVLERARDLFAAVEPWERHIDLTVLPDDDDLLLLGLTGFARDAADELRALAAAGNGDAAVAQEALQLLYRLGRDR